MIIEFLGVPGSGKTSLMPITLEKLRQLGFNARQDRGGVEEIFQQSSLIKPIMKLAPGTFRSALTWQMFTYLSVVYKYKFSWDHPGLFEWIAQWQHERPPSVQVEQRQILQKYKQLASTYAYLSHHLQSDDLIVFDEGLVHKAVQLYVSDVEPANRELIWSYLDLIPKPDLVIIVHVPVEESLYRIRQRGVWGHYRHKSSRQLEQFLINAEAAVEMATEHIQYLGWNLIRLDNSDSKFQNVTNDLSDRLESNLSFGNVQEPIEMTLA